MGPTKSGACIKVLVACVSLTCAGHAREPEHLTTREAPTREADLSEKQDVQTAEPSQQDASHDESLSESELTLQDYTPDAAKLRSAEPGNARRVHMEEGPEPEDVYLFLPRALLFLPNLALKLAFMPVRYSAQLVERYHVIEHVEDILYNDARTAGVVPIVDYHNAYGLSAGAKAFHNDLFDNDEELSASAEYGGLYLQAYKVSLEGDKVAHSPLWLEAQVRYETRPGVKFWGLGNQSLSNFAPAGLNDPREVAVETHFRQQRFMASALVGETVEQLSQRAQVGLLGILNRREFTLPASRIDGPATEAVYDTSALIGYDAGTTVVEAGPVFVFDSRNNEVLPASGAYLDTFGSYATAKTAASGYWHYGLIAAGFIDLYRGSRILMLRATLEGVHGDDADIPFTELMRIGGPERLRGYELDRFRDKLSAVVSAEYRYPVHDLVAGEVFVDAGRVGRDYPETFQLSNDNPIRVGGGFGFVFHDQDKVLFKAQAAYGEELTFFLSTSPLDLFQDREKRL